MQNVNTLFRSDAPEVLFVQNDWMAAIAGLTAYLEELEEQYGLQTLIIRSGHVGTGPVGFAAEGEISELELVDAGLRLDTERGRIVPDTDLEAGKALMEDFRAAWVERPTFPGMPSSITHFGVDGEAFIQYCGTERHGDYMYALWACLAEDLAGQVDRTIWEQVDPSVLEDVA